MNKENDLHLGGCYHSGLAYAIGYHVGDKMELDDELFTNFSTGIDGGIMAALEEHKRQFCRASDVKRFIVALKPVEIIMNVPDEKYDKPENNAGCDSCGEEDRIEGDTFCQDCIDDATCNNCHKLFCECICNDEDECDDCCEPSDDCFCYVPSPYNKQTDSEKENKEPFHMCEDELCEEFIADTFQPMNAFVRARWLKIKKKGN